MYNTHKNNGILMPTIQDFYEYTELALKIQPQESNTFFLPGSGWGAEIAIRGEVIGRPKHKKYLPFIPYRSHADFDVYATPPDFHYTPDFFKAFGSQEWFDQQQTKSFGREGKDFYTIPPDYMSKTAEVTELKGNKIKTLNIEFLLADKLLKDDFCFDKPKNHGRDISDSACIALLYDIDYDKVKDIIKNFYIQPKQEYFDKLISAETLHDKADIAKKLLLNEIQMLYDEQNLPWHKIGNIINQEDQKKILNNAENWQNNKIKPECCTEAVKNGILDFVKTNREEAAKHSTEIIFGKIDTFMRETAQHRQLLDGQITKANNSAINIAR